jgi:hypothetical protein
MAIADLPLSDMLTRPLRDLRISVTDRCQFRCTYCMPREVFGRDFAFLPREQLLTFEELTRLAGIFAGLGVRKLRRDIQMPSASQLSLFVLPVEQHQSTEESSEAAELPRSQLVLGQGEEPGHPGVPPAPILKGNLHPGLLIHSTVAEGLCGLGGDANGWLRSARCCLAAAL